MTTRRLLPPHVATWLPRALRDYATTAFSLHDPGVQVALTDFLDDPDTGIFRGPYVRTRMPYAPAAGAGGDMWLPDGFTPYIHQADAFARLTTAGGHQPEPTLVVTGTGSGKTEAFLYPIIDHVRRAIAAAREAGDPSHGVKALILYPMNALAADQADRLARLLTTNPELAHIRAGIYTGDQAGTNRIGVSEAGLITSRDEMRTAPPDILLTNYKMLDQLLLREVDRNLWAASADTLRYIVLDEFHTYDGAQGSDVAMLLRRLALVLADHCEDDDEAVRARLTPIATSATMGSDADRASILAFASRVFGRTFDEDAYVSETTLDVAAWQRVLVERTGITPPPAREVDWEALIEDLAAHVGDPGAFEDVTALRGIIATQLLGVPGDAPLPEIAVAAAHHPLFLAILHHTATAIPLYRAEPAFDPAAPDIEPLLTRLIPATIRDTAGRGRVEATLAHLVAFLADVRAEAAEDSSPLARLLPGVETHLWVRSIARLNRSVSDEPRFSWDDDVTADTDAEAIHWLPAIYCRLCGASGWMSVLEEGHDTRIDTSTAAIRKASLRSLDRDRVRPLMRLPGSDVTEDEVRVHWLDYARKTLGPHKTDDALPVLTYVGTDAAARAQSQDCPVCDRHDAVRFVGAAETTLLSVALSNLFGSAHMRDEEKRTLVFTDSVQDASFDASFINERNRALTLRTKITAALTTPERRGTTVGIDQISTALLERPRHDRGDAHSYLRARFELLPPLLAHMPAFKGFWEAPAEESRSAREARERAARDRLAADIALEFGYRSDLSRSLTSTGTLAVGVDVDDDTLAEIGAKALASAGVSGSLDGTDDRARTITWMRGIIETMRLKGAIYHALFEKFWEDDCNEFLLHNRTARELGYPRFTPRQPPEFPRIGPKGRASDGYTPLGSAKGRYARWSARWLGIDPVTASHAVIEAVEALAAGDTPVLHVHPVTRVGARLFSLEPSRVHVGAGAVRLLVCGHCHKRWGMAKACCRQLEGAPCLDASCDGWLSVTEPGASYYRELYSSDQPRSIIAAEHTSLVPAKERAALEAGFKVKQPTSPDVPNVLVATPTLEMGIDIGALSTVMLASTPLSVASYVQRVGRAGRLSGNSLALVVARRRSSNGHVWTHPLNTIAGRVAAPIAYLSAPMILRRQFLAALLDDLRPAEHDCLVPKDASSVLAHSGGTTLLDVVEGLPRADVEARLERFVATFGDHVSDRVVAELRAWALGEGPTTLRGDIEDARSSWHAERSMLGRRIGALRERIDVLTRHGGDKKDCGDKVVREDYLSCSSALRAARRRQRELRKEHWISALERRGLLPNFTLVDDTVELNIQRDTMDPVSHEFSTETLAYTRPIAQALYEFAPGSVFYVQSLAARIDGVEFDRDGGIEQWRLCPVCSYGAPIVALPEDCRACPACQTGRFVDSGQVVDVLPLRKVQAVVDPTRSAIRDGNDQRVRVARNATCVYSVPVGSKAQSWYVPNGFGITYYPTINVSWLNLGIGTGEELMIGSQRCKPGKFHVCAECGHVDSQAGTNLPSDHRPWCSLRRALTEETVSFLLGRTLRTEGLLMRLPLTLSADKITIPSLRAALKLGFYRTFGGDPTHLEITTLTLKGDDLRERALLLCDKVVGGTGYIARFRDPDAVKQLLEAARDHLVACRCAERGLAHCPDCLTPYLMGDGAGSGGGSRIAALHACETILGDDWDISETVPPRSPGSEAEVYFRQLITEACVDAGWIVQETGSLSRAMTIDTGAGGTSWRMTEQHHRGATIPDFYFTTPDSSIPDIAVYVDGKQWHLGDQVARDAELRTQLAAEGVWPITLTWDDLEAYRNGVGSPWPCRRGDDLRAIARQVGIGANDLSRLDLSPFALLMEVLRRPKENWSALADVAIVTIAKQGPGTGLTFGFAEGCAQLSLTGDYARAPEPWARLWRLANVVWPAAFGTRVHEVVVAVDGAVPAAPEGRVVVEDDTPIVGLGESAGLVAGAGAGSGAGSGSAAETGAGGEGRGGPGDLTDTDGPALPGEWAEGADLFEGDTDILEALGALADAGVRAPEEWEAEVAGVLTLATWGKVALIEEGPVPELARPAWEAEGWQAFDLDTIDRGISLLKGDN